MSLPGFHESSLNMLINTDATVRLSISLFDIYSEFKLKFADSLLYYAVSTAHVQLCSPNSVAFFFRYFLKILVASNPSIGSTVTSCNRYYKYTTVNSLIATST